MSKTSTVNDSPLALGNVGLKLDTIVPSGIRRRKGDAVSSPVVAGNLKGLENRKLSTSNDEILPKGWTRVKHPDFGVYYVNEERNLSTLSDLLQPRIRSLITEGADALRRSPALQAVLEDHQVDLVLDVQHSNEGTKTVYYCVSHVERRVFWLEGIGHEEVNIPCTSNKCMESEGSRVHCIEAQYWKHCELFPATFAVTKGVTCELKSILLQAAADRLLVKFSTSPFGKDELEYMLNIIKDIEADARERNGNGYSAWIIARFMALYNDGAFQSSYGQSDDYFDIEDTGPSIGPYRRPVLLTILGPLFLKSPDVYAAELHSFHESFTLARWSNFVHKVDQSIRDSNLLATVLLTTNVGLLTWTEAGDPGRFKTPGAEQIITYISIICSVGSIIIGLAIFKQYRAKGADTPLRAVVVLKRILKEPFGLERLSIICSLPYVLLMWGLIAFLTAFGIVFYKDTGIEVRIPVTIGLFIIVLCLFFCFYTGELPIKEGRKSQKPPREPASPSKV